MNDALTKHVGIAHNVKQFFFRDISSWWFWILFSLLCKGALFCLQIHLHPVENTQFQLENFWGGTWGDTGSYFEPIDNFIRFGKYAPDYRMPGYGIIYFPLALMFSKATAFNIIIIIQLVLSVLSVYCLALTAKNIFNRDMYFYLTFYLMAFSTFSSLYDSILLTESLATSLLIISIFFFTLYYRRQKNYLLIFSGLSLTWVIFLRPVFFPVLLLLALFLLFSKSGKTALLYLLFPFILSDGLWVMRNYNYYHRFIPLTKSLYVYNSENSYHAYVYKFCRAWGGTISDCNDWLLGQGQRQMPQFPDEIFTSAFNKDSLAEIHRFIDTITHSNVLSNQQKLLYETRVNQSLERYTESIIRNRPVLYYLKTPYKCLLSIFPIEYFSKIYLNPLTMLYSVFSYYIILILGLTGCMSLIFFFLKNPLALIIPFITYYIILIHSVYFRISENRFLVPVYPYIVIGAAFLVGFLFERFTVKKMN